MRFYERLKKIFIYSTIDQVSTLLKELYDINNKCALCMMTIFLRWLTTQTVINLKLYIEIIIYSNK